MGDMMRCLHQNSIGEWNQQRGLAGKWTEFIGDTHVPGPVSNRLGMAGSSAALGSAIARRWEAEHERWKCFYLKTW